MKTCRENLNKIKALCEELEDRDEQLKINATALWDILKSIEEAKGSLSCVQLKDDENQQKIDSIINKLDFISETVSNRGCKRVGGDE